MTAWLGIRGKGAGAIWEGGEKGARITIKLKGDKAGAWGAWSAGAKGTNLVALIAYKREIGFVQAISTAREFLGEAEPRHNRHPEQEPTNAGASKGGSAYRVHRIAKRLRGLHGTVAERYLIRIHVVLLARRPAGRTRSALIQWTVRSPAASPTTMAQLSPSIASS